MSDSKQLINKMTVGPNTCLIEKSSSNGRKKSCELTLFLAIMGIALIIALTIILHENLLFQPQIEACTSKPSLLKRSKPSNSLLSEFMYNAVAADQTVCSQIGSYILNIKNGNAIDAAIASILCVGVISCHSTGIGGGSLMIFYNSSERKSYALDFRETAPSAASTNMFVNRSDDASTVGGLAIATPGQVAGLYEAWQRFGSLPWDSLVTPTEEILRNGFRVPLSLSNAINSTVDRAMKKKMKNLINSLINPETGEVYKTGDIYKNERLAKTFAIIANDPTNFYSGQLANDIHDEIIEAGGIVSVDDLKKYTPKWRTPVMVTLRSGVTLHSLPPPSSGGLLAYILNIIDGYNYSSLSRSPIEEEALYFHRLTEAFKFAYAIRSKLGDEDFIDVTELLKNITSREFADMTREKITDDKTHPVEYYDSQYHWKEDHGTTHLSVIDSEGNSVSMTSTINTLFGSLVVGSKTGILYNNEMDDFSTPQRSNYFDVPPSPSNYIKPYKRPMSSMSPLIVTDPVEKNSILVIGAAGGTRITTAVAQTAIEVLFFNKSVKQAIDRPRLHHQLFPNFLQHEKRFPSEILTLLEKRGHNITLDRRTSVAEGIQKRGEKWLANCDFRKPSQPAGL